MTEGHVREISSYCARLGFLSHENAVSGNWTLIVADERRSARTSPGLKIVARRLVVTLPDTKVTSRYTHILSSVPRGFGPTTTEAASSGALPPVSGPSAARTAARRWPVRRAHSSSGLAVP